MTTHDDHATPAATDSEQLVPDLEQLAELLPFDAALEDELLDAGEHIAQFFRFSHLRPELRNVSRPFAQLARTVLATVPRNPERTVALRKLLDAKDAAVRASIAV